MAKIVLNKKPADFKKKVEIPILTGEVADVTLTFKYRARKEYAKLMDDHAAAVRERAGADQSAEDFSFEKFVGQSIDDDAELILQLASGWDLDDDFTKDNVVSLLDDYGGSGPLIVSAYRTAINEGRLGN